MKKRMISLLLTGLMCLFSIISVGGIHAKAAEGTMDYTETADTLLNPERGFYKALSAKLSKHGGELFSEHSIAQYSQSYGILHLRIGLEAFSANAGGESIDITEQAKQSLRNALQRLRNHRAGVIIRFSYNVEGETDEEGEYLEAEPSLDCVLMHVKSLGAVISSFSDVVLGVESGMLGPWGEQHSTVLGSASASNASTYHRLVQAWLESTPAELGVTVRRPRYFRYWANEQFGLNVAIDELQNFDFEKYPLANRVGVYNDGYLGSATDLGTFHKNNRDNEVAFLSMVGENTFYGGEVVADDETGGIGDYNSCDFIEKEGFLTHTSYLNIAWNYTKVISVWEQTAYSGKDPLYCGKTQFDYVNNHLGYRFVLRNSEIAFSTEKVEGEFTLANVGFGNLIRKGSCQIVLSKGSKKYAFATDVDLRTVKSGAERTFSFSFPLNVTLTGGEWSVYLDVTACSGKKIRFANKASNFNSAGNLLGYFTAKGETAEGKSFLVSFDGNGGTLVSGATSQIVKEGLAATPPVFEREGYRFVGWSERIDGIVSNLHVLAVWERIVEADASSSKEEDASFTDKESKEDNKEKTSCASATNVGWLFFTVLPLTWLRKKRRK